MSQISVLGSLAEVVCPSAVCTDSQLLQAEEFSCQEDDLTLPGGRFTT